MKLLPLAIFLLFICASCANAYRLVCYYPNWAYYRPGNGRFQVEDIDPFQCTHLMYGFAVLDNSTYTLRIYDPWLDVDQGNYKKFTALKQKNSKLKTLLALGGWNDSITPDKKYSVLVSDPALRAKFIQAVIPILKEYNFDGLDFDWEYPETAADKKGYVDLLQELRAAFDKEGLMLTSAVSCNNTKVDNGYDVPAVNKALDFISVMSYDVYGAWDLTTADHHAPLFARKWDTSSSITADRALQYWIAKGADREKLNLGIPTYGRTFQLKDTTQHTPPNAPALSAGMVGLYTNESGLMAYNEVCLKVKGGWTVVNDATGSMGPYAYGEGSWVGYDDVDAVVRKANYVNEHGIGGAILWDVSMDDFRNDCGGGIRPLVTNIVNTLNKDPASSTTQGPTTTRASAPTSKPTSCGTSDPRFIPHESDCTKYYQCDQNTYVLMQCPTGTVWNPSSNYCDWPINVPGCKP